ncbi:acetyl-CoA synthetase-like protein [Penicillium atrosanguineum]|uniref:Acetyl-CoA synthetase-like protein n=1 Tax=Penicillium atrosanguineum TaxID=1132637 RepID=A0A9W9Q1Q7_9EURO|nr:acetyl-CoA synthetase-like protein [Penicillium atrosanguineum]KAJ5318434.1 acetyl-CoA synthetase-like protein [Penicillium atrosanguineum]
MDLSGLSSFPDIELFPTFLDRVALEDPSKVWISSPRDVNDLSRGFRDYTARETANYENNAAWYATSIWIVVLLLVWHDEYTGIDC